MVDSTPTGVAPPSTMRSMRPPRSAKHMRRRRRRHVAGAVGRRRHHRPAESRKNVLRHGVMPGTRTRDAVEARRCQVGDRAAGGFRQHQRERSRPKSFGEPRRIGVEARERSRRRGIGDVRDQRIEGGAALGLVKPRHGLAIGGVGAEPVDGLGRKSDEAAAGEEPRRIARSRRRRPWQRVSPAGLSSRGHQCLNSQAHASAKRRNAAACGRGKPTCISRGATLLPMSECGSAW